MGATRSALVPLLGPHNNWFDLAGDEVGWRGRRGAGGPGGAPESSVGATRSVLVPPNNWSDLARGGQAWGGWARERERGGDGGGTREQCGSNKECWLVMRGVVWAPLKT